MLYTPGVRHAKVFLGGTTAKNGWRKEFMRLIVAYEIPVETCINPVVEHWDEAAQGLERQAKSDPSVLKFYYLGDTGDGTGNFLSFYSLHEATMGLYDDPLHTAVLFDYDGLAPRAAKRLKKVAEDLTGRFSLNSKPPIFESAAIAFPWLITQLAEHADAK